ncbi:MAG: DUF1624 domain-containing protein [Selenomonadaceae bacterium]|nr:DUF1624 domain-containing protein [Selenomonadaceae bacterium]
MKRFDSLDALRGLAILIMIFVDAPPVLEKIYPIFVHAQWEGLTFADLAFPGFVFTMGASAAISMSKRRPSRQKILKRAAILFAIGILFNELPYIFAYFLWDNFAGADFYERAIAHIRIFGILQRLALTYALGMFIVLTLRSEMKIFYTAFLLLILSSIGFHIYAPDNPFADGNNISQAIDFILPGVNHICEATHDPEGLYGTFACTASFLFGFFEGKILLENSRTKEKVMVICAAGVILLIAGGIWSNFDIIAKRIWTAPFALITSGIEILLFAAIIYALDRIPKAKNFLRPLCAIGMNPLFFFLMSNFMLLFFKILQVDGTGVYFLAYETVFEKIISPEFGSTIFCLIWTLSWLPLAQILYNRKVVIKI